MTLRSWNSSAIQKTLDPAILGQPNIPKPLHGINPRTIMGDTAWAQLRVNSISKYPYCRACGAETLKLDLHESYTIDYNKRKMSIKEYVPLCKLCHSFIHSGRLTVLLNNRKLSLDEAIKIMQHGVSICAEHSVSIFEGTYALAKYLCIDVTGVTKWSPPASGWDGWYLEYDGKQFKGLTQQQWSTQYGGKIS